MTWVLYILFGASSSHLQFVANYSKEEICKQASTSLAEKNVRAVCLPKENLK
jgi:hypothetical protein